jgi:hypothetical protein
MELACCEENGCEHRFRPFSKVLTPETKERLKTIAEEIREGNRKLSILIDEVDEPEMVIFTSIFEAIEDELSTIDSCINS